MKYQVLFSLTTMKKIKTVVYCSRDWRLGIDVSTTSVRRHVLAGKVVADGKGCKCVINNTVGADPGLSNRS